MQGNGIWMVGRFSIGWNFHRLRTHTTVALPLAVSVDSEAVYVFIGPITILWLRAAATTEQGAVKK